jgi:hypothetical protein
LTAHCCVILRTRILDKSWTKADFEACRFVRKSLILKVALPRGVVVLGACH